MSICEQLHQRLDFYSSRLAEALTAGDKNAAVYCVGVMDACDSILEVLSGEQYFEAHKDTKKLLRDAKEQFFLFTT